MKYTMVLPLLASLVVFATQAAADAPAPGVLPGPAVKSDIQFRVPDIKEGNLSNGIRVLFVEHHDVPLFSVHVVSTMGAADVPPGVAELASRSAVSSAYHSYWMRTSHKFNLIGASLSASSDYRHTTVSTHAMAPHLEEAIAELADIAKVEFPDGDIVRQKRDEATDALKKAESSSATYAARELLYPASHPYHYAQGGTAGAIRSIEADALRGFWSRAFVASNVTITASGDVPFDRLMKALEASFGKLPKGTPTPPSAPTAPALDERKGILLIDEPGTTQARVSVVARGVPRMHPDFVALNLGTHVLYGMLRERIRGAYGATYGVSVALEQERGTPPLWIYGSIENGAVGKGIDTILGALADLRAGKTTPELFERNRSFTYQRMARSFETSTETSGLLAGAVSLGVSVEELRALPARLAAVTPEQVKALTGKYLDPAHLRIVVVGDAKILSPELEKAGLGPIELRGAPDKGKPAPPAAKPVAAR